MKVKDVKGFPEERESNDDMVGFNAILKVIGSLELPEPHKCQCPESLGGKTVRMVNGLAICPRCGGVDIELPEQLERLDEKEIDNTTTDVLIDWDEDKNLLLSLRTINELSAKIAKAVFKRFGQPSHAGTSPKTVDVEKLAIKLMEVEQTYTDLSTSWETCTSQLKNEYMERATAIKDAIDKGEV